jgi:hypothetical protein
VFSCSSLTEEGIERVITTTDSLVAWHLAGFYVQDSTTLNMQALPI